MALTLKGKGDDYKNGQLTIPNGKYLLKKATITIGDNGIETINDGEWVRLKQ
ncbi:MAG: hypothetical protein GY861_17680 [bacterium]|nr:hypothetical protein [bacterium]